MDSGIHESVSERSTSKREKLSRTGFPAHSCPFIDMAQEGTRVLKDMKLADSELFQTIKRRDPGWPKYLFNSNGHFESLLSYLKGPPQTRGSLQ